VSYRLACRGIHTGFNGIQWELMSWESAVAASSGYCGTWLVATGNLLTLAVLADNSPNLEGVLYACVGGDVYWGSRSNSQV